MLPSSAPRRPTPGLQILRKVVRLRHPHDVRQKEIPADARDPLIMPILVEKRCAEFEKATARQTIVFKDDPLFDMIEKPGHRGAFAAANSKILLLKQRGNF